MDKKGYKVKSIQNVIKLLSVFSDNNLGLSLKELSEKTNLNKTTLFRILSNLEESAYIYKNIYTKKYYLGIKLFELGVLVKKNMIIQEICLPIMKEINSTVKETVGLAIAIGEKRAAIEEIASPNIVRYVMTLGKTYPLYAGADGRVILAFSSKDKIEKIVWKDKLVAFTDKTIVEPAKLERNLSEVRKKGYAISNGELFINSTAIAVPILKNNKEAIGALYVAGPSELFFNDKKIPKIIKLLKDNTNKISKKLSYKVDIT